MHFLASIPANHHLNNNSHPCLSKLEKLTITLDAYHAGSGNRGGDGMTTLTTPKAILVGFVFISLSIASLPYISQTIPQASAEYGTPSKIMFHGEIQKELRAVAEAVRNIRACNSPEST